MLSKPIRQWSEVQLGTSYLWAGLHLDATFELHRVVIEKRVKTRFLWIPYGDWEVVIKVSHYRDGGIRSDEFAFAKADTAYTTLDMLGLDCDVSDGDGYSDLLFPETPENLAILCDLAARDSRSHLSHLRKVNQAGILFLSVLGTRDTSVALEYLQLIGVPDPSAIMKSNRERTSARLKIKK